MMTSLDYATTTQLRNNNGSFFVHINAEIYGIIGTVRHNTFD